MPSQAIAFQYPCYICREVLLTATDVISHVICYHGFMLHERPEAKRVHGGDIRPPEANYEYQDLPLPNEKASSSIAIHSACPSCWYHCPVEEEIPAFRDHVKGVHDPQHYIHNGFQLADNRNGESSGRDSSPQDQEEGFEPTIEDIISKLLELEHLFRSHFPSE